MTSSKLYKNKLILCFLALFLATNSIFAFGSKDARAKKAQKKAQIIEETVKSNDVSAIKKMFLRNIDAVNYQNAETKDNLLIIAIKNDCTDEVLENLISYGVSTSAKNLNEEIPLMYACEFRNAKIVELMLTSESGFAWQRKNVATKVDINGLNSFDYAIKANRLEIVALLEQLTKFEYTKILEENEKSSEELAENNIENKKEEQNSLENQGENSETDLAENVENSVKSENSEETKDSENSENQIKKTEVLESENFTTFTPSDALKEPIYLFDVDDNAYVFEEEKPIENTPELSTKDINVVDNLGRTALMKAAATNNIVLMDKLIHSGADVNAQDNDGWTAAMFSVRYAESEIPLKMLKAKGADLSHENNFGISCLQIASRYCENEKVFEYLLQGRIASEHEVRSSFITAISAERSTKVLNEFLKLGLPLNQYYSDGMTPLMFAAKTNNDTKIIEYFIKNGARTNIRSKVGKSAYDYASENKRLKKDDIYWSLNSK